MAASASSILAAAVINIAAAVAFLALFSLLRRKGAWTHHFYNARKHTPAPHVLLKPNEIPNSFWGWVWVVWKYPEPDIIHQCGLDVAIFLRILKFGLEVFLWLSAWCLLVVLPANYSDYQVDQLMSSGSNSTDDSSYKTTDFDKLSLSNVQPGSYRMFAHVFTVWFVTAVVLRVMWRYCQESVLLRVMFIGASPRNGPSHSILVTDIPAISDHTEKVLKEADGKQGVIQEMLDLPRTVMRGARVLPTEMLQLPQTVMRGAMRGARLVPEIIHNRLARLRAHHSSAARASAAAAAAAAVAHDDEMRVSNTGAPLPLQQQPSSSNQDVESGLPPPPPGHQAASASELALDAVGALEAGDRCTDARRRWRATETVIAVTYDLHDDSLNPHAIAHDALKLGATPEELVEGEFGSIFPDDQIVAINVVHDQSALDKLVEEYEKIKQQLEDFIDEVEYKLEHKLPLVRRKVLLFLPPLGKWGKEQYGSGLVRRVDKLEYQIARMQELERQILEKQCRARLAACPSAFVTFSTRLAQSVAATSMVVHDERAWRTRNAPMPEELIWENLGMTSSTRSSASLVGWVAFWLLASFFMIPVTAIQGLIDVPKLATYPGLQGFVTNPVVQKLLEAIVPGLALRLFLLIIPYILSIMARRAGAVSLSQVDFSVVTRFYLFQVVVVFFGTVIVGSFFNQATQLLQDPASIVTVLGTAIPQTATFFITYVWIQVATRCIGHLRPFALLVYGVMTWMAQGPRAKLRAYTEQYTTFGTSVTYHMMVLMLGLVFCAINPIICPSALVYFVFASLVERYDHIFVFRRKYESGGLMWKRVFTQVMVALYIFQLCMIGLISIKKFPYSALIIPVLIPTFLFHLNVLSLFSRPWTLMSLHDAASLDWGDKSEAAEGPHSSDPSQLYLSPVFKITKGSIDTLLGQARAAGAKVDIDIQRQQEERAEKKKLKH